MKTLFICDEFVYDVTGKTLNWTEENPWFQDEPTLNSTFPFDIFYGEIPYFQQYKYFNGYNLKTRFDGRITLPNGKIYPAYLEIQDAADKLKGTIRAGLELFPTWDKKLTELPLGTVNPPGGMLPYAETIISQTWPAVTHNFPMVWCLDLYKDDPLFTDYFHGYYNKRVQPTGFIQNIEVPELNTFANHNIVYPFPYYMHLLHTGVNMAGYTLQGDILNDLEFTKALMPIRKVEFTERPETVEWLVGQIDIIDEDGPLKAYRSEVTLEPNTRYRIKGNYYYDPIFPFQYLVLASIKFNGVTFHSLNLNSTESEYEVDFHIPPGEGGTLVLTCIYRLLPSNGFTDIFEGEIIPTHIYDEDGNLIPAIANFNNVNLAEMLPEITFGELIKILRAWKNYDFDIKDGKIVEMNLVDNQMGHDKPVDLRRFDIKNPPRKYEQQGSFILKFSEENEEHPFTQTFVSLNAVITSETPSDFPSDDNTKEITINAIPLPVLPVSAIGSATTAKMITDDSSKPTLVLYDGLNGDGNNWTKPVDDLLTPVCTDRYWFRFMMFSIKSILYRWTVRGKISDFFNLTKKSKILAYNNYMIVKSLNRKQTGKYEEIDIEARTF